MPIDTYYNGTEGNQATSQLMPPFNGGRSFFVLRVGTAHKLTDKPTCGISQTYLIPGDSAEQAVTSFLKWCRDVIADVRNNMEQSDLTEAKWLSVVDALDPRAREARELQKEIEEIESTLDKDNYASIGWWQSRLKRLRRQKAALLTPDTEVKSRFELIVRPVRNLIDWLEAGYLSITPIPDNQPIPVSYFNDWRGFTTYQRKQ